MSLVLLVDADMILAAQAALLSAAGEDVVIATGNVHHLSLFAAARRWQDIHPSDADGNGAAGSRED